MRSAFSTGIFNNGLIAWGVVLEVVLALAINYTPMGNWLLDTAPVPGELWLLLIAAGAAMLVLEELRKWIVRNILGYDGRIRPNRETPLKGSADRHQNPRARSSMSSRALDSINFVSGPAVHAAGYKLCAASAAIWRMPHNSFRVGKAKRPRQYDSGLRGGHASLCPPLQVIPVDREPL